MRNYASIIAALLIIFIIVSIFRPRVEGYTGSRYYDEYTLMGNYAMQGSNPMMSSKYPAKYRATFMSDWGKDPAITAPENPHTGNMFYAVQNGELNLFQPGQLASKGISNTSMFGTIDDLQAQVRGDSNVLKTYSAPVLMLRQRQQQSTMLDLTPSFNSISFVTMIAPSPDWFVSISNLSLMKNGQWINDMTVPLYVYDAGTDRGMDFSNMPDYPQTPPQSIKMITGKPFFVNGSPKPIAQMRLQRVG